MNILHYPPETFEFILLVEDKNHRSSAMLACSWIALRKQFLCSGLRVTNISHDLTTDSPNSIILSYVSYINPQVHMWYSHSNRDPFCTSTLVQRLLWGQCLSKQFINSGCKESIESGNSSSGTSLNLLLDLFPISL